MATFVLVAGATWGGWCWKKVSPLLRAAGHEVYAPTLTGLGERAHLLSREIGLGTHIQDILNVLWYEDLTEIVLVGHSYGGMVLSGVAEQAAERLAHLVYLQALVPEDGEADIDIIPPEGSVLIREQVVAEGEGWHWLPPFSARRFGLTEASDIAWVKERLTPHPYHSLTEPIHLDPSAGIRVPRTYIRCTGSTGQGAAAERAKDWPGWSYLELTAGHAPMVTAPRELAELLVRVASGTSEGSAQG